MTSEKARLKREARRMRKRTPQPPIVPTCARCGERLLTASGFCLVCASNRASIVRDTTPLFGGLIALALPLIAGNRDRRFNPDTDLCTKSNSITPSTPPQQWRPAKCTKPCTHFFTTRQRSLKSFQIADATRDEQAVTIRAYVVCIPSAAEDAFETALQAAIEAAAAKTLEVPQANTK